MGTGCLVWHVVKHIRVWWCAMSALMTDKVCQGAASHKLLHGRNKSSLSEMLGAQVTTEPLHSVAQVSCQTGLRFRSNVKLRYCLPTLKSKPYDNQYSYSKAHFCSGVLGGLAALHPLSAGQGGGGGRGGDGDHLSSAGGFRGRGQSHMLPLACCPVFRGPALGQALMR